MDSARREALVEHLVLREGFSHADIRWSYQPLLRGRGWDNEMWEVGQLDPGAARCGGARLVLRVPHREMGEQLLRGEVRALAQLDAHRPDLPLTRPVVVGSGGMQRGGRRPYALLTWVEGDLVSAIVAAELREGGLRAGPRRESAAGPRRESAAGPMRERPEAARLAIELARALADLHRPAPEDYPRSAVRGVALRERTDALQGEILALDASAPHLASVVREIWQQGLDAAPYSGDPLLLHGDPHPANLIRTDGPHPLGLIDWGDTTAGDPASDLGWLLLLDPSGSALSAYARARGGRDADGEARARAWAVRCATAMLVHEADPADTAHADLALCARAALEAFASPW